MYLTLSASRGTARVDRSLPRCSAAADCAEGALLSKRHRYQRSRKRGQETTSAAPRVTRATVRIEKANPRRIRIPADCTRLPFIPSTQPLHFSFAKAKGTVVRHRRLLESCAADTLCAVPAARSWVNAPADLPLQGSSSSRPVVSGNPTSSNQPGCLFRPPSSNFPRRPWLRIAFASRDAPLASEPLPNVVFCAAREHFCSFVHPRARDP